MSVGKVRSMGAIRKPRLSKGYLELGMCSPLILVGSSWIGRLTNEPCHDPHTGIMLVYCRLEQTNKVQQKSNFN
jgi:hypothetical protein